VLLQRREICETRLGARHRNPRSDKVANAGGGVGKRYSCALTGLNALGQNLISVIAW